ncbi:MAG: hypothetical protein Q7K57_40240 [Burkholderiaceae bacterium]|nr:hypothetical protein [Burkholderiaceae bacterium]
MPTAHREPAFLPADDCLPAYEQAVLSIAKRRLLRLLFVERTAIPISEILNKANISINALAGVFIELKDSGNLEYLDQKLKLTDAGRRWVLRERKAIFMKKVVVAYKAPVLGNTRLGASHTTFNVLPEKYRFSWLDGKGDLPL